MGYTLHVSNRETVPRARYFDLQIVSVRLNPARYPKRAFDLPIGWTGGDEFL